MEQENLQENILDLVREKKPETVDELVDLLIGQREISRQKALEEVVELENQGRLKLTPKPKPVPEKLNEYLFTSHAYWFWLILLLSATTTISVFTVESPPLVYIRYVLGSVFVLLLPGYSLIKTLFPTKEIDNIERTALSIGMSLALVPLVGLLLNYTPWGIRLTPITLSLLALTTLLTATAVTREQTKKLEEQSEE
jgi:hypothetical protein